MKLQWNPLKYGDALGLTRGPLSGRAPGKLTDQGIDLQQKLNPFISRKDLEHSNDIAPYVAAAIASLGSSALPEAAPAAGEAATEAGATGAFDMWGSQSSPTDASTIFDESPHGPMNPSGGQPYKSQGMGVKQQPHMGPRPHDYLAYLQGQPSQSPFSPPMGQGTFWGGPMTKGMFGLGGGYGQS